MGGRGQQKTKDKNKDPSLSLPPPPPPSCLPNLDSMEPSTNCPSEALSRPTNCCPAGQDLAWSKYCTSELSAAGVSYSLTTSLCQCNPFAFLHNSCSLSMPLLDAHPFINHLMSCHADWLHANMVGREVVNQGTHGWQRWSTRVAREVFIHGKHALQRDVNNQCKHGRQSGFPLPHCCGSNSCAYSKVPHLAVQLNLKFKFFSAVC